MAKKKKEKRMPPINASFEQLVKESVDGNPTQKKRIKLEKPNILQIEAFFKSFDEEMWKLASTQSEGLTAAERKGMFERLVLLKNGVYELTNRAITRIK